MTTTLDMTKTPTWRNTARNGMLLLAFLAVLGGCTTVTPPPAVQSLVHVEPAGQPAPRPTLAPTPSDCAEGAVPGIAARCAAAPTGMPGAATATTAEQSPALSGTSPLKPPEDLWRRLRRGMRIPPAGGAAAARTQAHERWYRANRAHMLRTFTRARLYLHDIVEAVEREGMPTEIALLPAVESAFIPMAKSHANAEGLWQFIRPTGRRFALKQHLFLDDRRSVRAATQAALRYLNELQARYGGDYQLALAAYNTGEGNVDAAIARARARGLPGRYEDLRLHPETLDYVPKLLALATLVAQAVDSGDLEGAGLPPMADAPYFAAVRIRRDLDLKLAAELAGMSLPDFRALNPQHRKPVIVAAATAEVLVPVERRASFEEALANYRGPLATWSAATVDQRSGVDALARAHGTTPQLIREVNEIPPGHVVAAGSTIVVPRVPHAGDIAAETAGQSSLVTLPLLVRVAIRVVRGDTWARLSQRLALNEAEFHRWNGQVQLPRRGGTVKLMVPTTVTSALAAAAPKAKGKATRETAPGAPGVGRPATRPTPTRGAPPSHPRTGRQVAHTVRH